MPLDMAEILELSGSYGFHYFFLFIFFSVSTDLMLSSLFYFHKRVQQMFLCYSVSFSSL